MVVQLHFGSNCPSEVRHYCLERIRKCHQDGDCVNSSYEICNNHCPLEILYHFPKYFKELISLKVIDEL